MQVWSLYTVKSHGSGGLVVLFHTSRRTRARAHDAIVAQQTRPASYSTILMRYLNVMVNILNRPIYSFLSGGNELSFEGDATTKV